MSIKTVAALPKALSRFALSTVEMVEGEFFREWLIRDIQGKCGYGVGRRGLCRIL
jgi:hypothetical protein